MKNKVFVSSLRKEARTPGGLSLASSCLCVLRFAGCQLVILSSILLFTLAACGGSGITQTVQTEHYKVQLTLDGANFDEHTATINIDDLSGQPVTADQVVLAPVMETMGMASPEQTAQAMAPGRYQAKAAFFA